MTSISDKGYVAAKDFEFLYPAAGDARPPGGAKVLLLTKGGICTSGHWGHGFFIGWAPLPSRNKEKEKKA